MNKNVKFDVQLRGSAVAKRTFIEVEEASSSSESVKKMSRNNLNQEPSTSTKNDRINKRKATN